MKKTQFGKMSYDLIWKIRSMAKEQNKTPDEIIRSLVENWEKTRQNPLSVQIQTGIKEDMNHENAISQIKDARHYNRRRFSCE